MLAGATDEPLGDLLAGGTPDAQHVAPSLLPFVHLFYGHPSTYYWWDCEGTDGEGIGGKCFRGKGVSRDTFSAIGQHAALSEAQNLLQADEEVFARQDTHVRLVRRA